jgi:2-oxoisovalerate dehydrogenase E2 component (dihydrolipoyl transacylase)
VKALHYKKGDMAKVGTPLIDIDLGGSAGSSGGGGSTGSGAGSSSASASPLVAAVAVSPGAIAAALSNAAGFSESSADGDRPQASPAVRRIAKENNINLALVHGTGPKGRILKEDVQNFVKNGGTAASAPISAAAAATAPIVVAVPTGATGAAAGAAGASKAFPAGLPQAAYVLRCFISV